MNDATVANDAVTGTPPGRRGPATATALMAASSAISVAAGVVTSRCWAHTVGAGGLGRASVIQSAAGFAGIVAGFGLATSVVRCGAELVRHGRLGEFRAIVADGWRLWSVAAVAAAALLVAVVPLVPAALEYRWPEAAAAALVAALSAAAAYAVGVLSAHHRVALQAFAAAASSIATMAITVPILRAYGEAGVVAAVAAPSVGAWLIAYACYRAVDAGARLAQPAPADATRRRDLVRLSATLVASGIVGTGVATIVPLLVADRCGLAATGLYRAASSIAATQLGFLFTAMGRDFYPRLSAVRADDDAVRRAFAAQWRFSTPFGIVAVLALMACARWALRLLYSGDFAAAEPLLDWLLVGHVFKVAGWCIAFVPAARSSPWTLFRCEAAFGGVLLVATWVGMSRFGVVGAGIGFAATHAAYLAMIAWVAQREVPRLIGPARLLGVLAAAAVAVSIWWLKRG